MVAVYSTRQLEDSVAIWTIRIRTIRIRTLRTEVALTA